MLSMLANGCDSISSGVRLIASGYPGASVGWGCRKIDWRGKDGVIRFARGRFGFPVAKFGN